MRFPKAADGATKISASPQVKMIPSGSTILLGQDYMKTIKLDFSAPLARVKPVVMSTKFDKKEDFVQL